VNLKYIGVGLFASVASMSLAACGGSGSSPGVATPPQSAAVARGTLKFTFSNTKKVASTNSGRKPAYVSPGFTNATLLIDSTSNVSNPCTAATCTITFTTTPGPPTFAVEIDDGKYILAEGTQTYTLVSGDNTAQFQSTPLTLNGVAYGWFLDAAADGAGTISLSDAAGYVIVSAAGNIDNGPITLASSDSSVATITSANLLPVPLSGYNAFTYQCSPTLAAPATFTLVVSEAATPTPSIPLTLTPTLAYGPSPAPLLGYSGTLSQSITCPSATPTATASPSATPTATATASP